VARAAARDTTPLTLCLPSQLVASEAGPTLTGVTAANAKVFLLDLCRAAVEARGRQRRAGRPERHGPNTC
jgi:hypothetical protein